MFNSLHASHACFFYAQAVAEIRAALEENKAEVVEAEEAAEEKADGGQAVEPVQPAAEPADQ